MRTFDSSSGRNGSAPVKENGPERESSVEGIDWAYLNEDAARPSDVEGELLTEMEDHLSGLSLRPPEEEEVSYEVVQERIELNSYVEPPQHFINGEPFNVVVDGDIILTHDTWSLTGHGDTLLEAEIDLIEQARIVAPVYTERSETEMTREAIRLKEFILEVT